MNFIFWLIGGLVLISALSAYCLTLWRKVWFNQQSLLKNQQDKTQRLKNDLLIIAKTFQVNQIPNIEAAIRLKVLLDNLDPLLSQQPEFQVLHQIYDATSHIPTHNAWKALPRAERKKYEQLLKELEIEHKPALTLAVEKILTLLTQPS